MEDLKELRKTAAQATQGEWWMKQFEPNVCDIFAGDGSGDNPGVAEAWHPEDATHIATFDPPTVLALLSRLEQAEQAVQRVREVADEAKMQEIHMQWISPQEILEALDGDGRG